MLKHPFLFSQDLLSMKPKEKPDKETLKKWHDDPANWRLGIFYYNPIDKRLLPPKRISELGWTVNYGNPYSILFMLAIVILIVIIGKYVHF